MIATQEFRIGQTIDRETWRQAFGQRGLWLADADPQWFILTTAPGAELPAEAWLRRNGVPECWYPTETRWRRIPGPRKRKVAYLAPIVPRYLFVVFDRIPQWDVLFDRLRGKVTGVVSRDGIPLPIPEAVMRHMRHVPATLAAIRQKREIAARIRPGDRAEVIDGPLSGWTVDVAQIHDGIASIIIPMLGKNEVTVPAWQLRKAG